MKIAIYIRPCAMYNPTGVGKHQENMLLELSRMSAVDICVIAARRDLRDGRLSGDTRFKDMPVIQLPMSARNLERCWTLLRVPCIDHLLPEVDWIYSPFEAVPVSRKAKVAATVHQAMWFEKDLEWYRLWRRSRMKFGVLFRRMRQRCDLVAAVSEYLRGRLCGRHGFDERRTAVVGNGVEEEFFAAGELAGSSSDRLPYPYLLVVGALDPRKGAQNVVRLARHLAGACSPLKIVIAYGISSMEPYLSACRSLPNVVLREYCGRNELPRLMRNAVALLMFSQTETFGIPVAEAMAAGAPVLIEPAMALPEVAGDAGIVVDSRDVREVERVVMSLMNDEVLRKKHVERGKLRAREFHWSACALRLVTAMESISKRGAPA